MQHSPQYLEEEPISLLEYWKILKRRRILFLTAGVIAFVTAISALHLPLKYRSEATILIEEQEIPEDIVGATITSFVSQQIELISQRLLTVKNLQVLIEKFEVYGSVNPDNPISGTALAALFREDMELDLVSTEVIDTRGRSSEAAIAFTLAFNSSDPEISQKITQELVSLFLDENQRISASRTTGVSQLLRAAVNEANEELLKTEAELADFKEKNASALPELYQLNLNVIGRTEQQLSDVNLRIQQLEQRKLELSVQLAALSPSAPVTLPSGETVMSDRDRLRALLVDFRRKTSIYQADHPDLVRLEREIELLRRTVGDSGSYEILQKQLRQEREKLEMLRDRYSDVYPDIKNSEAAIAELESQLAATNSRNFVEMEVPDNPAYVLINTQLQSTSLEFKSLLQKRNELREIITEHEALIRKSPQVEMHYTALTRRHENAGTKYGDLQTKLRAAEVSADVEQEITGQRFTLIEPALLPLRPEGPNRPATVVLGLLLAFGVATGCVVLAEFMDNSIRSAKKLADITGSPPLAVISYLNNSADIARARLRRIYLISAVYGGIALSIVYVVFVIQPFRAFF